MPVKIRKPREITSVEGLVRLLKPRSGNPKLLFRGQNVDKPLLPKIARNRSVDIEELGKLERQMLERFKKEAHNFLPGGAPQTDWDWLSVAQHQGLPTRLLDWTANALAGLWFAVCDELADETENPVLWVLTVQQEHLKSPSPNQDIFELRRTYVFQPYHIDRRIAAQSGWFSVHRYSEGSGRFIPLDRNKQYKTRLKKYLIPGSAIGPIRRELRLMGVTHATMFPDLSGLCASIQAEFLEELPDIKRI
jgi:FRG domain